MGKRKAPGPVFLNNRKILPWEKPSPPGKISLQHMYNGSTEILEFIDLDQIRGVIAPPYEVYANAVKYLAKIAPLMGLLGNRTPESPGVEPVEQILFVGGIQIYRAGISGTELPRGLELVTNGDIWTSTQPDEYSKTSLGLNRLIFGLRESEKVRASRIKRIIEGYEIQEHNSELP